MKRNPKSWTFLTIEGERRYSGNTGYVDDPVETYRYDSSVANCKQVAVGDVIFLRSRTEILGIARIEKISTSNGKKERLRCPECGITKIEQRKSLQPLWACRNQHTFDNPIRDTKAIEAFAAHYGATFRMISTGLTVSDLDDAVIRPNPQMSIKEIDLSRIERWLRDDPNCNTLLKKFVLDFDIDNLVDASDDDPPHSVIEARRRVLREVNQRRGQAKFRNRLIARYGAACQISRCAFSGLVEAAHIRPYAETNDNGAHNGLLLRSDLHTLFDLNLLAIDPLTLTVKLHPEVRAAGYEAFDGISLFLNYTVGPDLAALSDRWQAFQLRQAGENASSPSAAVTIPV